MLSAETVLNIIEEDNLELLKKIIPPTAYELIVKKYSKEESIPYLKRIVKKYENKQKIINEINQMDNKTKLLEKIVDNF